MTTPRKKPVARVAETTARKLPDSAKEENAEGLFNKSNPYNIYTLVGNKNYHKDLSKAQEVMEELSRDEIEDHVKDNCSITDKKLLEVLRTSFWFEFDTALSSHREMALGRVFETHCGSLRFKRLLRDPMLFSYILYRPLRDEIKLRSLLNKGFDRFMEILDMPLKDFKDRPNVPLMKEMREIYKLADNRLNGGIVQKLHQTSLSVDAKKSDIPQLENLTDEEIERQLLELQQKQNANQLVIHAEPTKQTIEVKATPVIKGETEEN